MIRIPKRLNKTPLIEALWEIRFQSHLASIGNLLPGFIFKEFPGEFEKVVPLPLSSVPPEVRETDPNLRFLPAVRLAGSPYAIQIGDRVVSLSCQRPYTGWTNFGGKILRLAELLKQTGLVSTPERFSMKYVDILKSDGRPMSTLLNASIELAGKPVTDQPVSLRVETTEGEFLNIAQIVSPAQVKLADGEEIKGIVVDNDTIYNHQGQLNFWAALTSKLDAMHDFNKKLFFEVVSEKTIVELEPEY